MSHKASLKFVRLNAPAEFVRLNAPLPFWGGAFTFVCYPLYCFCNFPFPRMGFLPVGGKGKSCRCELLCYGIKGWIRQPVDENRGSIISCLLLIFGRSFVRWRDASATVLCQKTVQLSRYIETVSAKWVMTSHI